jgi:hypothetical protein
LKNEEKNVSKFRLVPNLCPRFGKFLKMKNKGVSILDPPKPLYLEPPPNNVNL